MGTFTRGSGATIIFVSLGVLFSLMMLGAHFAKDDPPNQYAGIITANSVEDVVHVTSQTHRVINNSKNGVSCNVVVTPNETTIIFGWK